MVDICFNTYNNYHTIIVGSDTSSTNEDGLIVTQKATFEQEIQIDDDTLTTLVTNLGWN